MDKRFKKMALVRLILIMQNTLCTWRINIFIHQVRPGLLNKEMLNFCALLEIQNMYSICLRLRHFWCKTCFHFSIHLLSDYEVHFRNDFGIAMIFNIMFHFILSFRLTASPLMNPHPPPPVSLFHFFTWFPAGFPSETSDFSIHELPIPLSSSVIRIASLLMCFSKILPVP